MKDIMIYKENNLGGNFLCYIPQTPQAYYVNTKKQAIEFCNKINSKFKNGSLKLENGKIVKN